MKTGNYIFIYIFFVLCTRWLRSANKSLGTKQTLGSYSDETNKHKLTKVPSLRRKTVKQVKTKKGTFKESKRNYLSEKMVSDASLVYKLECNWSHYLSKYVLFNGLKTFVLFQCLTKMCIIRFSNSDLTHLI